MPEDMDQQESMDSQVESTEEYSDDSEETEETEETQVADDSQEQEVTEKGTRLDPDPKSAVHQQLANERRMREQYQRVLQDPDLLQQYAQRFGLTKQEAKDEVKSSAYSADTFKTADDIAKTFNEFQEKVSTYEKQIGELKQQLSSTAVSNRAQEYTNNLRSSVTAVQDKYPELNSKGNSYDPDLEKEIADMYQDTLVEDQYGNVVREVPLDRIADGVMRAYYRAKKSGSQEAQTRTVEKRAGKVVTSSKRVSDKQSDSELSPEQTIAQRIASLYK